MTDDPAQPAPALSSIDPHRRVISIRLLSRRGGTALASLADSTGGVFALALSPIADDQLAPAQQAFDIQSAFGAPGWDSTIVGGELAAVWTRPGSAISPLVWRTGDRQDTVLTSEYPMGVFEVPRFVRGTDSPAVTALTERDGVRVVALFRDGRPAYEILPPAASGLLVAGLLVRQNPGYLLFAAAVPPGPRLPERYDLSGQSLQPGVLAALPLDARFEPAGQSTRPFGNLPIFEFDGDVSDSRAFLLATTATGYVTTKGQLTAGAWQWSRPSMVAAAAPAFAPAVLASGETALAALIEAASTGQTLVRIGRY